MSPPKNRDLPPLQNSIAVLPDYLALRSTTLVLKETAPGYDFDITDRTTGETLFTAKGSTDSQTASTEVFDTKGKLLFALLKHNARALSKDHRLEAPDGSPFMSVEWSWGKSAEFTSRFTNTLTREPVEMSMNASYFRRNGDWKIDGQTVAHVFRDAWTSKDMLKGKRTYYLTVAPGMDMAVAVAACLYVHERVNEGSGSDPVFAKSDLAAVCCVS